jgi:hypothetical protein
MIATGSSQFATAKKLAIAADRGYPTHETQRSEASCLPPAGAVAVNWLFYVDLLADSAIVEGGGLMALKRTMTLNLTDAEMQALETLAEQKDLSKTAVLRQALRLYQVIDDRISRGEKVLFEDDKKKQSELMVL